MKEVTENELFLAIGKATMNGLVVKSTTSGAEFTTSQLSNMNSQSLIKLYNGIAPSANKIVWNSDKTQTDSIGIDAQIEFLTVLISWKENEDSRKEAAKIARKEAEKRLAMFSKITNKAEEDRIAALSPEALQAEIAAAQMIVEAKSFI